MQPTFDINRAQQATSAEPFFQQYQPHLGPINLIVMRSGELMEGNMMYPDRTTPIKSSPSQEMYRIMKRMPA
jgi:hypothetical protein